MTADEVLLDKAIGRMRTAMLWLAFGGAIAAWLWQGWSYGLGFLAGALASAVNFHLLHQVTATLGPEMPRPRSRMVGFFCLRYLLLGLGGYVIVKIFGLNLTAALLGLFVAAAAVILEIFYEIIYVRA